MPDPDTRSLIDSNIWLYAFIQGDDAEKTARARSVVQAGGAAVSTQVINEVCVNLIAKAGFAEEDVRRMVTAFYRRCTVLPLDQMTLL